MGLLMRRHKEELPKEETKVEEEPLESTLSVEEDESGDETIPTSEPIYPKALGGGWYRLSDNTKVQGEDNAKDLEADLKEGD